MSSPRGLKSRLGRTKRYESCLPARVLSRAALTRFRAAEPLASDDCLDGFDCGVISLNSWLIEHAREGGEIGTARSFVIIDSEQQRVVGYHALAAFSLRRGLLPAAERSKLPRYPVPAVLLCRLAVDLSVQGRGLGAELLADAMLRTAAAAAVIGAHSMIVHAISEPAAAFYRRFGFEPLPDDPRTLRFAIAEIPLSR